MMTKKPIVPEAPEKPPRRRAAEVAEAVAAHRLRIIRVLRKKITTKPTMAVKAENMEETLITRAQKMELSASPTLVITHGQRMR